MFPDNDWLAIGSAVIAGVGTMVFGVGCWYGIKGAITRYREANKVMAVRNKH